MSQPEMIVDSDGSKNWYLNGVLHREDGPALDWNNGYKSWYFHGKRHRIGGPAEISDGSRYYHINDVEYSFEDYLNKLVELGYGKEAEKLLWDLNNV
jgi:hypothetical protein